MEMTKENAAMLQELQRAGKEHLDKCKELLATYELACLGYDMQWQQSKDVTDRVLKEHEFYATMPCERLGIKVGDRITAEDATFLLSDNDFHRLHELKLPILVAEGITDKDGYYIEKWVDIRCAARRELVDFIIENLIPSAIRSVFREYKWSVVKTDKLIDIFRNNLKK